MSTIIPKGGFTIAGHKVPWEAVGALAAVIGVVLVIRARQSGQQVAAVGQAPATAPATAADTGFGLSAPVDDSAQLANITQQLTSLSQSLGSTPATPPAPVVTVPSGPVLGPPVAGAPITVRGQTAAPWPSGVAQPGWRLAEITSING